MERLAVDRARGPSGCTFLQPPQGGETPPAGAAPLTAPPRQMSAAILAQTQHFS
ncbi:MAG: hypothetical protein FWD46_07600 [Cystobacterineae bacterium]|nr:hypothetical protein [Cystobacterineae bacterium]